MESTYSGGVKMEKIKARPVTVSAYIKKEGKGSFALYIGKGLKIPFRHSEHTSIRNAKKAAQSMAVSVCITV